GRVRVRPPRHPRGQGLRRARGRRAHHHSEREREQQVEDGRYFRFERRFGTFTRTIGLPQGVTEKDVHASFKDGVLEVHVAKPVQAKPQKISISVGGSGSEPKTIEGTATQK